MECVHKAWTKNPNFMWNKSQKKKNVSDNKTTRAIILNNILWNMQQCQCIGWLFFFLFSSPFSVHLFSTLSLVCIYVRNMKTIKQLMHMNYGWFMIYYRIYFFYIFFSCVFYFNILCVQRIAEKLSRQSHYTKRWRMAELHAIQMTIFDTIVFIQSDSFRTSCCQVN